MIAAAQFVDQRLSWVPHRLDSTLILIMGIARNVKSHNIFFKEYSGDINCFIL
jgi:hypothetical protein